MASTSNFCVNWNRKDKEHPYYNFPTGFFYRPFFTSLTITILIRCMVTINCSYDMGEILNTLAPLPVVGYILSHRYIRMAQSKYTPWPHVSVHTHSLCPTVFCLGNSWGRVTYGTVCTTLDILYD